MLASNSVQAAAPGDQSASPHAVLVDFLNANRDADVYFRPDGRVGRVYGAAFGQGATPEESVQAFLDANVGMWGVQLDELSPAGPFEDGRHVQPIMYVPETDSYKFTGYYYTQQADGLPVFRGQLKLLVRNEPGYPLVLASADLRNLGGFEPGAAARQAVDEAALLASAQGEFGPGTQVSDAELVVFAGVDDFAVEPAVAVSYIAESFDGGDHQKWLIVVNAQTGAELYRESKIHNVDVTGNVSALVTQGTGADFCGAEASEPMPYARVTSGATVTFADVNGDYVLPNGGTGSITLDSAIRGQYFRVFNQSGADSSLSLTVTPPGPANFVHNALNVDEFDRAEVNAYIHANIVRDMVMAANPTYPVIAGQTEFPANVNIGQNCNAYYDGVSINFYTSGGGCSNTAFSVVVHHEYGHHVVSTGGSGQGAYGEGMSDVMGVVITDTPQLALGFQNNCLVPLRNADNTCQYLTSGCSTCGSAIHSCGQLISGCVWSTRNEMVVTEPSDYLQILQSLAVNSVLVHTGSSITPQIFIDWLTLDDDDGNIFNGTPHFNEIHTGFDAHSMVPPDFALALVDFIFPDGRPDLVAPVGGTTVRVEVQPLLGEPMLGSGRFHLDTGSGFVELTMTEVSDNVYDAVFPSIPCGSQASYYFSAMTVTAVEQTSPVGAPANFYTAISAAGEGTVSFQDDFESDLGWTVTNSAGLADGAWTRGVPIGGGDRGDPPADADGSGQCYVTDNVDGNSDVDGGTTTLTSPVMDATGEATTVTYWRWFSNTEGSAPMEDTMIIEVSDNGGLSWVNLETVGPTGTDVSGGWFLKSFSLADIPGFNLNNQFRIRFSPSDLINGSIVEAGVDGVTLQQLDCEGQACPADVAGDDGVVDISDLLAMLGAWGSNDPQFDLDMSGTVDINDLLDLLSAWGPCP
ncbi:MAG: GC-type dockerin domain-anchored protein [Planctomycetota bacterium]